MTADLDRAEPVRWTLPPLMEAHGIRIEVAANLRGLGVRCEGCKMGTRGSMLVLRLTAPSLVEPDLTVLCYMCAARALAGIWGWKDA